MHVIEWILKEPGVQDGLLMVIGLACIMAGGYVAFGPGGGMIVTGLVLFMLGSPAPKFLRPDK